MKKRQSVFAVLIASLFPQPLLAIESGVNAMITAQELEEKVGVQAWAFEELRELITGGRSQLDPVLPQVSSGFDLLDAKIALFVSEGQQEVERIIQEYKERNEPQQQEETAAGFTGATDVDVFKEVLEVTFPEGFFSPTLESEMFPTVTFNDDDRLAVDTGSLLDVPDLTIDPRNGGEYYSEIEKVQEVMDVVQLTQDQVPAPIQSTLNQTFDTISGKIINGEP